MFPSFPSGFDFDYQSGALTSKLLRNAPTRTSLKDFTRALVRKTFRHGRIRSWHFSNYYDVRQTASVFNVILVIVYMHIKVAPLRRPTCPSLISLTILWTLSSMYYYAPPADRGTIVCGVCGVVPRFFQTSFCPHHSRVKIADSCHTPDSEKPQALTVSL